MQIGPGAAEVTSDELGLNCWHPHRFVEGGSRCEHIMTCKYPEKAKCQAVQAEIDFLGRHIIEIYEQALGRMQREGQAIVELMKLQK